VIACGSRYRNGLRGPRSIIKAINAMPRVILAPIFFVWFGLGIASTVPWG